MTENKNKKIIKDLEILVYKINLENFNLKDRLENKLQNRKDGNLILLEEKTENLRDKLTLIKPNKEDFTDISNKDFKNKFSINSNAIMMLKKKINT